jgi:DNA-binding beta-propeller fold protein YncE
MKASNDRRRRLWLAAALALVAAPAAASQLVEGVGFNACEASRYDDAGDHYLVTNMAERGAGAADGFISRIAPDGTVRTLRWIHGLYDPRGIFLHGDRVYVADNTHVRMFDRVTGAPRGAVEVPGSITLNDLAVAPDGTVYVTDSGSNDQPGAIWKIDPRGRVSAFAARNPALERPNGIAVLPDGNIVHGGRGVNLVIRTPQGRIVREVTLPTGQFDGIVVMPDGRLLVASQLGRNVYRVDLAGGAVMPVAENIEVPAAIGLDTRRMRLLVPQIRASSLTIYELAPPAS